MIMPPGHRHRKETVFLIARDPAAPWRIAATLHGGRRFHS